MRRFARHDQEGQAIVLAAFMFLTLLFFVGLAVDVGQLYSAKRTEQEASDAAAFAGAIIFYQSGHQPPNAADVTAAITAARSSAIQNGYTGGCVLSTAGACTDAASKTTVTVNSPPASGLYSGDPNHIEVIIMRQIQTTLVPAQSAFNPVTARGVAGAESFNNGYALMALDQSCTNATLSLAPNENIHLSGGGAVINSCGAQAVSGVSPSQDFQINACPGCSVDVVGGVSTAFPPSITVRTGVPPVPDPFAGYPMPDRATVAAMPLNPPIAGGVAYSGVYTTALDGVKLCGGIYVLKAGFGGDISQQTTGIDPYTLKPCDGRTFMFNTLTNYPDPGGTCQGMGRNGNHPITLRPMTLGPYKNFGIYQDPACTAPMQIGGVAQALDAGGTIYLPTAVLHMNGNPATVGGGQLIAFQLDIQNSNLDITYNANNTAQPVLPRLAE